MNTNIIVYFLILIPCIMDYVEINQLNALNYILHYFSFAETCRSHRKRKIKKCIIQCI
jgi:hypothetical protein